jgi:hypothetical protein
MTTDYSLPTISWNCTGLLRVILFIRSSYAGAVER